MRVVIQRVSKASVSIHQKEISAIGHGMLILLGIEEADEAQDIKWLCSKIAKLRIFDDLKGVMNLALDEISGQILVVSQFTLFAQTKKGNRPSYIKAAGTEKAILLYELFIKEMQKETKSPIQTGQFGAMMHIELVNDGPVTIIMDSKQKDF